MLKCLCWRVRRVTNEKLSTIVRKLWTQYYNDIDDTVLSAKVYYDILRNIYMRQNSYCRSQCPRSPRRSSAAAPLLSWWVGSPSGAWIFVFFECCVLSGRGLCDGLVTRPRESYRLWCVVQCELETPWIRRPWPTGGCCARRKKTFLIMLNLAADNEIARGARGKTGKLH
jgi:hypothetical protein